MVPYCSSRERTISKSRGHRSYTTHYRTSTTQRYRDCWPYQQDWALSTPPILPRSWLPARSRDQDYTYEALANQMTAKRLTSEAKEESKQIEMLTAELTPSFVKLARRPFQLLSMDFACTRVDALAPRSYSHDLCMWLHVVPILPWNMAPVVDSAIMSHTADGSLSLWSHLCRK